MATTFMNLSLPVPTVTIGPDWAEDVNSAFETIDEHDHSSGKGQKVRTAGLNIDADLTLNSNRITNVEAASFTSQNATLTGVSNANSMYVANNNLYFTNGSGTAVQLTSGGSIASVAGAVENIEIVALGGDITINPASTAVMYIVDTSAARSVTLPLAAATAAGRIYVFKDATGSSFQNAITIDVAGSDTIDGEASYVVESNSEAVWLVSDGAASWYIA